MKSKRKFLSIFAILFALVFGLSVCFFAACKGGSKDDEKGDDTTTEQGDDTGTKNDDDDTDDDGNEKNPATVSKVELSQASLELEVGDDPVELSATVTMSETGTAFDGTCTWTASPSGVVTVVGDTADSTKATVTAVAAGEATITVKAGEESATCAVTVTEPYVDPYNEVTTLDDLESYTESTGTEAEAETQYVRLGADLVGTITVSATVVLDLNGHTLQNVEDTTPYDEVGDASDEDGKDVVNDTVTVTSTGSLTILDGTCTDDETVAEGSIKNIYSTTLDGETTSGYSSDSAAVIFTEGTVVIESGLIDGASVGIRAQGGTITINGGKISSDFYAIWEDVGAVTVTINDGEICGVRKGIYVGGDGNFGLDGYQTNAETTLIINDGSVTCEKDSAICTLGFTSVDSAYIEINGGTLKSEYVDADTTTPGTGDSSTRIPAIYLPGGTLKVTDGEISGATALEVRGGKTTITGGTFTATGSTTNTPAYQGSGATSYGYSIAVYPFGERNSRYTSDPNFDVSTDVAISGGTFVGPIFKTYDGGYASTVDAGSLTYTFAVTGGVFTADPSSYLEEEYKAVNYSSDAIASGWKVVASDLVAELDMEDGRFTTGTTIVAEAAGTGATVNYNDSASTSTGFTATSNSSGKKIIVETQSTSDGVAHTVLSFNGSGRCDRNSVSYTFIEAGTYDVVLSYFSGNGGRYATVLTGSGQGTEVGTVQENEKTDGETKIIITRTVQVTVEANTTIYIGSKNSGIYVTYIGIFSVTTN